MDALACVFCDRTGTPTTMRWSIVLDEVMHPEADGKIPRGVACPECATPEDDTVANHDEEPDPTREDLLEFLRDYGNETWILGPATERWLDGLPPSRYPTTITSATIEPPDPIDLPELAESSVLRDHALDVATEAWEERQLEWALDPNDATKMFLEPSAEWTVDPMNSDRLIAAVKGQ